MPRMLNLGRQLRNYFHFIWFLRIVGFGKVMIHQKSHSELDWTLDHSPSFTSWLGLLSCSLLPYLVISRSQELTYVVYHIRCKASFLNSSSVGCSDLRDTLLTDKPGPSVSDTCLPFLDKKKKTWL